LVGGRITGVMVCAIRRDEGEPRIAARPDLRVWAALTQAGLEWRQ
jgi:hypothetical protein